jgi:adenylate cyclase
MIKPSSEIASVVVRWLAAHSGKNGRPLVNMLSISDHLRYLGSAPDEYWAGSLLRRGITQHISEVPDWTANNAVVECFENGETGWGIWRAQLTFAGRSNNLDVRFSFVLTLDDCVWRIVQIHCSMAAPNIDFHGMEQNTFADLIEAAQKGHEGFGDEGAAVIMFTDVANSTEIANALGDRDWAVAMGRQLDLQASAIARHDGILVKTLGDGSMSSFGSARSAMRAAADIQTATTGSVVEPISKLRIGIHAGDVIQTGGDFFGTVVNKASRITALAQPNEILVSDVARSMAGDPGEFVFGDPLIVALRGIEERHSISNQNWSA